MGRADPNELVYRDGSRTSLIQWMGPGVVVYLVFHAFLTNQGVALLIAIPLAFYVVFTWHSSYYLYRNTLVVQYFWPRQMVVPLAEIAVVRETKVFPAGEGLLLSRPAKGPLFIRPQNASLFLNLINEQIESLRQPPPEPVRQEQSRPRPRRRRRRPGR